MRWAKRLLKPSNHWMTLLGDLQTESESRSWSILACVPDVRNVLSALHCLHASGTAQLC